MDIQNTRIRLVWIEVFWIQHIPGHPAAIKASVFHRLRHSHPAFGLVVKRRASAQPAIAHRVQFLQTCRFGANEQQLAIDKRKRLDRSLHDEDPLKTVRKAIQFDVILDRRREIQRVFMNEQGVSAYARAIRSHRVTNAKSPFAQLLQRLVFSDPVKIGILVQSKPDAIAAKHIHAIFCRSEVLNGQRFGFNQSRPCALAWIHLKQGGHKRALSLPFLSNHIDLIVGDLDHRRVEERAGQRRQLAFLPQIKMGAFFIRDARAIDIKRNLVEHLIIGFVGLPVFANKQNERSIAQTARDLRVVKVKRRDFLRFAALKGQLINRRFSFPLFPVAAKDDRVVVKKSEIGFLAKRSQWPDRSVFPLV